MLEMSGRRDHKNFFQVAAEQALALAQALALHRAREYRTGEERPEPGVAATTQCIRFR